MLFSTSCIIDEVDRIKIKEKNKNLDKGTNKFSERITFGDEAVKNYFIIILPTTFFTPTKFFSTRVKHCPIEMTKLLTTFFALHTSLKRSGSGSI